MSLACESATHSSIPAEICTLVMQDEIKDQRNCSTAQLSIFIVAIIYSLLVPCGSSVHCLMLKMLQQFQEKDLSSYNLIHVSAV